MSASNLSLPLDFESDSAAEWLRENHEMEKLLAWAARAGDATAREVLICAGRRWVQLHARRLGHVGARYDDAVAAGNEALIRAIDRFDPSRGVRLVTFAWSWIARAMQPMTVADVPVEDITDEPEPWDYSVFDQLSDTQRQVVLLRFGFGTEQREPLSRQAVSQTLGMSVWQVRSIEAKAISQLREALGRVSDRAP